MSLWDAMSHNVSYLDPKLLHTHTVLHLYLGDVFPRHMTLVGFIYVMKCDEMYTY